MDRQDIVSLDQLELVKFASFLREIETIAAENPEVADLLLKTAMPGVFKPFVVAGKAIGAGAKGAAGAIGQGLNRANIMAHAIHAGAHGPEMFEGAEKIVHGLAGGHLSSGLINAAPHFYGAGQHAFTSHVMPAARAAGNALQSGVKSLGRVVPRLPGPPAAPAFA